MYDMLYARFFENRKMTNQFLSAYCSSFFIHLDKKEATSNLTAETHVWYPRKFIHRSSIMQYYLKKFLQEHSKICKMW